MLMQCAYMFCLPYDMQYVYLFVLLILPHLISIWVFVRSYKNIILDKWTTFKQIGMKYLIWFIVIKYGLVTPTNYSIYVLCHLVVTMKNLNHWMDEKQNLPKRMQNVELTPSSKHHSICHQKMMLCLFCIFSFSYSI